MKFKFNHRNKVGGLTLLARVDDSAAALAWFDPQHTSVLDRQEYGNAIARQKGRGSLAEMHEPTIRAFVAEIERALKPSGHLMLWVDKFVVAERAWAGWVSRETNLRCVDLLHWNKGRIGLGRRLRCQSEYLVVMQKEPLRAARIWTDRGIPDTWLEGADRGRHPHAKPLALVQRLIRATTKRGEIVIDPAAGGFCVLDACLATGRTFLGCDIANSGEN